MKTRGFRALGARKHVKTRGFRAPGRRKRVKTRDLPPGVSFHTCFTEDFETPRVQKAWLEAPRVSFHTCFTEDFDNSDAKKLIFYVNLR